MMTQSVMTQAVNKFGSATGNVTSKGKKIGSGFDLMIDSSLKSGQNNTDHEVASVTKKTFVQTSNAKGSKKSDKTDGNEKPNDVTRTNEASKNGKTNASEQTSSNQTGKTGDVTKTKAKQSATEEQTIDEQVLTQIAGLMQSVREAVMDQLKLSTEELDQLLMDQGMNVNDLLQPENLQQLALANNGETDILAVLTDENLADTMKQLIQTVEGVKAEANLPFTEEQMKLILAQAEGNVTNPKEQSDFASRFDKGQEMAEATNVTMITNVTEEESELSLSELNNRKNGSVEVTKRMDTLESNTGTQSDTNEQESKDLNSTDHFQVFVDNLVKVSQEKQVDFSGNLVQVTELRDIANQIIERIKVSIQPDQTSMELQLNPENLGKVNLSVQSKNGVMTAQFVVQNELSKEAIESQLHTLRETLNQQGIKVEAIEVTVSAYAFDQSNQDGSNNQTQDQKNRSGKHISLEEAFSMSELSNEDSNTENVTGLLGSQIDYTA